MGGHLRRGVSLAACVAALGCAGNAAAATFEVVTTADSAAPTPAGHSLRSAILAANAAPGPDTVLVPAGLYRLTLGGANEDAGLVGDLDVVDDLTITGTAGSTTIDGNGLDRVLHVLAPTPGVLPQVTFEGLRIVGGSVVPAATFDGGGGVKNDGALTVKNSVVELNRVDGAGFSAAGGGVLSSGPLTLEGSSVNGNISRNVEGVALGGGLAVFANGVIELELSGATVSGNVADAFLCGQGQGGGLYLSNAVKTAIADSTIGPGNEAHTSCIDGDIDSDEGQGGGIYNATSGGDDTPAVLTLARTSVVRNTASQGGGIYNAGPLAITAASSVSENTAAGDNGVDARGGGIYNRFGRLGGFSGQSALQIANSSLERNTARALGPDSDAEGGGIDNQNGGIEIVDSLLGANVATAANKDADGGGIYSSTFGCGECGGTRGHLSLTNTTVTGNAADGRGGGVHVRGDEGDLGRYEQASLRGSTISENRADRGAGIFARGTAETVVAETTVSENVAALSGGGLYLEATYARVEASTISANSAPAEAASNRGGGIFAIGGEFADDFQGEVALENSTVHGNVAHTGGGIAIVSGNPEVLAVPTFSLRTSTVAGNSAQVGTGVYTEGRPTVFSSILAGAGTLCSGQPLTSLGYNLDQSAGTCGLARETDLLGVDPLLGPLADNGGPTETRLPLDGSPAIDHVPDCGGSDQRGILRPQGLTCDVGSVEVEADDGGGGGTGNFIVDDDRVQCPTASYTTIQAAIDAAPDDTTIQVCAGTYAGDVAVHNRVTLQGPGTSPAQTCATWVPADPSEDAIVEGGSIGLSLQVSGVVVDGLVVHGAGIGIETSAEFSGFQILDNVIAANTFGVELDSGGEQRSVVARNCFTGNTRAGLHGDQLSNASIDHNAFIVDASSPSEVWGVFLGRIECCGEPATVTAVDVDDNVATGSDGNKRFAELSHTLDVNVRRNVAAGFGSAVIFLANGNAFTDVTGNELSNSHVGVWISDIGFAGGTVNLGAEISGNTLRAMSVYGIGVEAGNSLASSTISGNTITASGVDGIRIQGGPNNNNTISGNTLSGSDEHDCHDDTAGEGTRGTWNTWVDNEGGTSQPSGLCGAGTLTVSDATAAEGDALTFTVTLDRASTGVSVQYATRAGSATESDYTATSGTLTFGSHELSKTITVPTTEDGADEPDETVFLDLSSPANATIADGEGLGTIADDDEPLGVADLALTKTDSADPVAAGGQLTYTITVQNNGPAPAADAAVSDTLPAGVSLVSATASAGTCSGSAVVTCALGTLAPSTGAVVTIVVTPQTAGTLTNTATATTSSVDPSELNNSDSEQTTVTPPSITIRNASVAEGNAGDTPLVFTLTRSTTVGTSAVNFATSDDTATAGSDYRAASGSVTFAPGEDTKTISVAVIGDVVDEPNEVLLVTLSPEANASVPGSPARGTIGDDDEVPTLSIGDATVTEGNSGSTAAVFTVTRTPGAGTSTVAWATSAGTAGAADFTAASGGISFAAGETSKTISIAVLGDTLDETDETFTVDLSSPRDATIADGQGVGTILDDDTTVPPGPVAVSGPCRKHGTLRDDQLSGSSAPDWICGWRGADLLLGLSGADRLLGGDGNDTLDGGYGADALTGGAGNDVIVAYGQGADTVEGGPGFDTCYCGPEDSFTGIERIIPQRK